MVSTLARILDIDFKRIQFTPDLMPSDITGTNVLEEDEHGRRHFRFVEGPIFTNILLADEINRTPPKTQAALLQAMQEREVTVGQQTYTLPDPFFTIATQNPIEQEGTYPLPEAQLDRFMFNIKVDYPTSDEEERILGLDHARRKAGSSQGALRPGDPEPAEAGRLGGRSANTSSNTRHGWCGRRGPKTSRPRRSSRELVDWGAGPRAGQFLIHGGKALAAMEGRFSVAIDDIQKVAIPVLRHRVSTNFQAQAEGMNYRRRRSAACSTEIPTPEIPKFRMSQHTAQRRQDSRRRTLAGTGLVR